MKKLEILAPAGTYQTLKAVVKAGADAVYLGGPAYGARAYAGNFTEKELLEAIDYAHLRGCKVYLTVNTLIKNQELSGLREYILPYYRQGLDAVLVQDIGVLKYLHEQFPLLPLHTSTQMTVASADGVRALQRYGVTRVVMARETSFAEMKKIHEETGMELEAFVHGALCYSYSGQCLFSSILGGRSGNRGRCAQPCRLPYTVLGEDKRTVKKESYVLSLKDLCGLPDLSELQKAGVYSLKIEGRMKSPEYAAGVVSVYRKYADRIEEGLKAEASAKDLQKLAAIGSRCGFTDLYYHKHNDPTMVTWSKPNFSAEDSGLQEKIHGQFVDQADRLPVTGKAVFRLDAPSSLTVRYGSYQATAVCPPAAEAQSRAAEKADIISRLQKTGQTPFYFEELQVEMGDNLFIPNGILNQLRRDALQALEEEILARYRRKENAYTDKNQKKRDNGITAGASSNIFCSASVEDFPQLQPLLKEDGIARIYLDLALYQKDAALFMKSMQDCREAGKEFYVSLPVICRSYTAKTLEGLAQAGLFENADGFLVHNYEELFWCRKHFPGKRVQADHNLYAWNDQAISALREMGADGVTMPLELSAGEIALRANRGTEMIIYGYYPLMTTAGCVHANTAGCDHKPQTCYLRDRYQVLFPVKNRCSECTNIIYNSLPTCLFEQVKRLKAQEISSFRFSFTIESAEEVKNVLASYCDTEAGRSRNTKSQKTTNGHYKRGVE